VDLNPRYSRPGHDGKVKVNAALATHLEQPGADLSDEELLRLRQLIDELQRRADRGERN